MRGNVVCEIVSCACTGSSSIGGELPKTRVSSFEAHRRADMKNLSKIPTSIFCASHRFCQLCGPRELGVATRLPPASPSRRARRRPRRRPRSAGASPSRSPPPPANFTGLVREAVSKRNFARKYAFESSRRDLHNALSDSFAQLCNLNFCQKFTKISLNFAKFR